MVRTAGATSKQTHLIEDGAFFFVLQMGRECEYMPNIPPTDLGGGVWMIGVAQLGEGQPILDWPMKYRTAENGYSPELIIEVPEDAEVGYDDW